MFAPAQCSNCTDREGGSPISSAQQAPLLSYKIFYPIPTPVLAPFVVLFNSLYVINFYPYFMQIIRYTVRSAGDCKLVSKDGKYSNIIPLPSSVPPIPQSSGASPMGKLGWTRVCSRDWCKSGLFLRGGEGSASRPLPRWGRQSQAYPPTSRCVPATRISSVDALVRPFPPS